MPFVRVYLNDTHSIDNCKKISESIHTSLVSVFNIPQDDIFHVIQHIKPELMFFPGEYLKIPHSSDILFIQITGKAGRAAQMKQTLYQTIATNIHEKTNISKNDIVICYLENNVEDWSFGQGKAQLI